MRIEGGLKIYCIESSHAVVLKLFTINVTVYVSQQGALERELQTLTLTNNFSFFTTLPSIVEEIKQKTPTKLLKEKYTSNSKKVCMLFDFLSQQGTLFRKSTVSINTINIVCVIKCIACAVIFSNLIPFKES